MALRLYKGRVRRSRGGSKPGEPSFDLAWMTTETVFVVEVKSTTAKNEEKQLRLGLGQVLDTSTCCRSGMLSTPSSQFSQQSECPGTLRGPICANGLESGWSGRIRCQTSLSHDGSLIAFGARGSRA